MRTAKPDLSRFVNINGQHITPQGPSFERAKPAPSAARRVKTLGEESKPATQHHGWVPLGFSPSRLQAAEADAKAKKLAFSAEAFMNGAPPPARRPASLRHRVRRQPLRRTAAQGRLAACRSPARHQVTQGATAPCRN